MRLLRQFHDWLLWSDGRAVYLVLFVFALLPFAVAPAIGTWQSFVLPGAPCPDSKPGWIGLDAAWNWWIWPLILPASLWLVRRAARDMFGSGAAIAGVVGVDDRPLAQRRLKHVGHDARSTLGVLVLMVVLIPVEFWGVGAAYLGRRCPKELDWTVFFLAESHTAVSWQKNLVHVALAYPAQYLTGFFAILTFVLFFRHNWLYLRWIYQRHRRNRGTPRIELDFDDEIDYCFGQLKMRGAFNLQVWVLVLTGVAIVISRAVNVAESATEGLYRETTGAVGRGIGPGFVLTTLQELTEVEWRAVYPDAGQIVLVVMFVLVFVFVSMPSLVKFLPFRAGKLREGGAKKYLAEFIPAGRKNDPDRLKAEGIGELAGKFRRNSFWPAGDNVAQRLFGFVFAVLLFVVLPVPVWKVQSGIVYLVLLIVVALALTIAVFVVYRYVLGWVAAILVRDPKK